MVAMINSTASFSGMGIQMAGKTGTAQQSAIHPDHAVFVGFAPAESPEIAIAVRIANGYTSAYAAEIGRDIVMANFELAEEDELITGQAAKLGESISD
jgi:penicillin-binding protein 2